MRGLQQHRQQQDSEHLLDFLPYEEEEPIEQGRKARTQRSKPSLEIWNVTAFLFTVAISSFAGVHLGSEMARQTVEVVPGWEKRPPTKEAPLSEETTEQSASSRQTEPEATEEESVMEPEQVQTNMAPAAMATPNTEDTHGPGSLEVTAKLLNIRGGPDTGAALISQANQGEVLQKVRKVSSPNPQHPCWFEVILSSGKAGFVACEFVKDAGEL